MCIKEQQPRADQNTQHLLDKQHTRAGQNIQPSTKSEKFNHVQCRADLPKQLVLRLSFIKVFVDLR